MTRPRLAVITAREPRQVLICAGCRHAWEPREDRAADHPLALARGCPACGDWLYLTELAQRDAAGDLR